MDVVVLVGRILFVMLFIGGGMNHFTQTKSMGEYAASKGVPSAPLLVVVSGVQLVVGALMVLLGIWADLGALILAAFLLPAAMMMHNFWTVEDEQARQTEMAQFMKNMALVGACLMLFAFFAHVQDLDLTITEPLFELD